MAGVQEYRSASGNQYATGANDHAQQPAELSELHDTESLHAPPVCSGWFGVLCLTVCPLAAITV